MNILITGGNGFLGQQIVKLLLNRHNLTILIRKKKQKKILSKKVKYIVERNIFDKDKNWFKKRLVKIDIVIHCAWYVNPLNYLDSVENIKCLNGTVNLALASAEIGVKKFIGIGTSFEYDLSKKFLSTKTSLDPNTLYSACKASAYFILKNIFNSNKKIIFKWCRVFYLYGNNEKPQRLYSIIINNLKKNKSINLGSGDQIRDYLEVSKAGKIIINYIFSKSNGAKNICSGKPISIKKFALNIEKKMGKKGIIKFSKKAKGRKNDPKIIVGVK